MKTALLILSVVAFRLVLTPLSASELQLPDDPFAFPVLPKERIGVAAHIAGFASGMHVRLLTGPYTREHLSWIAQNGRKMDGSQTVSREDFLDDDALHQLLEVMTPERQVFFYALGSGDLSFCPEWGYIVIEGDTLVRRIILGQELD